MKKLLIFFAIIALMAGCKTKDEIRIGFSGPLTGKNSDFGIDGRNGVIFAVEEINRKGGINDRLVKLYTSDDKGDTKAAVTGDQALIKQGVIAIIGHMTSSMTLAAMEIVNQKKIVMISPTTSTDLLNGIDDYVIRIVGSTTIEAKNLAEQAYKKLNIKKVGFIYDKANEGYTKSWVENFIKTNRSLGGKTIFSIPFNSQNKISFSVIVRKALSKKTDAVCIAANSRDTALICQQIRKSNSYIKIISCAWAQTRDILIHGGKSVEGILFSHQFSSDIRTPGFTEFSNNYKKRFGQKPEFASVFSYNAALVLFDALSRNRNPNELKDTILEKKIYKGIDKEIIIDKYGDSITSYHLITIRNNEFAELK